MRIRPFRLFRPLSIKKKLFVFFLLLFCAPFLVFCMIWYAKSADTIEESGVYYNKQLIQRVNMQLDEYFTGTKADTLALPGHPLVQEFVKLEPNDTYGMYLLKDRLFKELTPNLSKDIYGFSIVSMRGAYFGDLFAQLDPSGLYDLPLQDETFTILGVSEKNDVPVILVSRKIIDNVTYQPAGVLIMALSLNQMLKIADIKPYGKNGSIVIADKDGRIIYHTDSKKWGGLLPETWEGKLDEESGQFVQDDPEGKKIMVYQTSQVTHFKIISETSKYELLGGLLRLQLLTLMIGAFILALAFVTFYRMFREVKKLLGENHASRMREKEIELRHREALMSALQSRINPHFLYNTLEIINSYAVVARVKPISQMTINLSNIFRYSVNSPVQVVSLREELDYIKSYIQIQEQRFEELTFELNVDESMLDQVYLYRLTIQPLVENAFHHGYEKRGLAPGHIAITGVAEESMFSLYIEDHGQGMPEELTYKYNEAFEKVADGRMLREGYSPFPTIGLWNVHARLRLGFGVPYGVRIVRSNETGSIIQMKLPYVKGVGIDVQSAHCG